MILSDAEILEAIEKKEIVISPFDRKHIGSNSYDVHLGDYLASYTQEELDVKKDNPVKEWKIPKEGYILSPNKLYLGVTKEYTETMNCVPFLEGKSSIGRLGLYIHATAGKGDVGFCNHWTLEITVIHKIKIYPGMPIGQLIYFKIYGKVLQNYLNKKNAKYNTKNTKPVASMMWKNF